MPGTERDIAAPLTAQLQIATDQVDDIRRLADLLLDVLVVVRCEGHRGVLWRTGLRERRKTTAGVSLPWNYLLATGLGRTSSEVLSVARRRIIAITPIRVNVQLQRCSVLPQTWR